MLVLTRKKNQGIMLGDNVIITILEVKDDHVKIGIDAPRETRILRRELYKFVSEENITAVSNERNSLEILKNLLSIDK